MRIPADSAAASGAAGGARRAGSV